MRIWPVQRQADGQESASRKSLLPVHRPRRSCLGCLDWIRGLIRTAGASSNYPTVVCTMLSISHTQFLFLCINNEEEEKPRFSQHINIPTPGDLQNSRIFKLKSPTFFKGVAFYSSNFP